MPNIGLQLYTVRELLAGDFEGVVRHVAEIGYEGVETGGVYGESPADAARLFRELGLQVSSAHLSLDNPEKAVDVAQTLGTKRVVCAWYPPERFTTVEAIRGVCEELNRANQVLRASGLELLYHNHWQECGIVEGKPAYQHMLTFLEPTVDFEVDVYWAKTAGRDPLAMLRELGKRAPLVHMKDGPASSQEAAMTALGEGVVDIRSIANATRTTADWWIVELDRCDTDMMQAVEKSFAYLKNLRDG
ncbi:MAG TPA: sugar phosphate isomerase/epimerase [Anaerolineae bacterium]|nr:sugar phosphate isomerase/epimerase [Anaerolineae bacterium]